MQILTKKQVKYCRVVTKKSAVIDYCLGIFFQDKLFVAEKFFASDRQRQAVDYCYRKYLAEGGKKSYILISNVAELTVWQEDKFAQIVGTKSPKSFIADLELDRFIIQIRDTKILISDRYNNSETNRLFDSLETSLQRIIDWEQKVRDGFWLGSVESMKPFDRNCFNAQFS